MVKLTVREGEFMIKVAKTDGKWELFSEEENRLLSAEEAEVLKVQRDKRDANNKKKFIGDTFLVARFHGKGYAMINQSTLEVQSAIYKNI